MAVVGRSTWLLGSPARTGRSHIERKHQDAKALLGSVGARYAAMPSYRDEGRVLRSGSSRPLLTFRTWFARDLGLRFEVTRSNRLESISNSTANAEELMAALAAVTGVSAGVASTIPALLLPTAFGDEWSLLRLADVRGARASTKEPFDTTWKWLAGTGWMGQPFRIAIDPATLLIRRVEDSTVSKSGPQIIEYDPQTEAEITADQIFGNELA
jgi:hypothetical protein